MSDFFAPSYWYGAGPGAAFSDVNNAVAQNQANIIPSMNANMAYVGGQNQAALNNAYGPLGFGGLTSHYSALGAAHGRATGGFNAKPATSVFSTGAAPFNTYGYPAAMWNNMTPAVREQVAASRGGSYSGGGIGSDAARVPAAVPQRPSFPVQSQDWDTTFSNTVSGDSSNPYPLGDSSWYPSQRTPYSGGGNTYGYPAAMWANMTPAVREQVAASRGGVMAAGGGDQMGPSGTAGGQTATPHNQMFRMPAANPNYFNKGIYAGSQGSYGIPYNGRLQAGDVGFSRQPSYPNLGYNPGMQNWFANPGFGMGLPNAGETPTNDDRRLAPWMNPNPGGG